MIKVYCYSRCTTCKKALKWLDEKGIEHEVIDIKTDHPDEDEQLALLATDGMLVKRPLVVGEDFVLTGFKEKEWIEKLQ